MISQINIKYYLHVSNILLLLMFTKYDPVELYKPFFPNKTLFVSIKTTILLGGICSLGNYGC